MPITIQQIIIQASIDNSTDDSEKNASENNKEVTNLEEKSSSNHNIEANDKIDIDEIISACVDEVKEYLKQLKEK